MKEEKLKSQVPNAKPVVENKIHRIGDNINLNDRGMEGSTLPPTISRVVQPPKAEDSKPSKEKSSE